MNILEYNSGFDFIDMMNEFDYEYIKFMGGRANGTYMLGIDDENEMLYMELPVDDYDGRVRKVAALGLKKVSFYRDGLITCVIVQHRVVRPSNSREL